ncbi:unnamed protein product [Didymodactylos carnosus]|uniref:Uncharacterized protein n=1 Tax=Didymodactylos carnosus TaxID=1234261 RepID=A0A8S2DPY9_9BILA|nr:unnamed protein product [Didymodactylos carnosus]CAF3790307.1 unnamed protein product [Didymodactylos carnosus]
MGNYEQALNHNTLAVYFTQNKSIGHHAHTSSVPLTDKVYYDEDQDARVYNNLGMTYAKLGDLDRALDAHYIAFLELHELPENHPAKERSEYSAEIRLSTLPENHPDRFDVCKTLGCHYAAAKQFDKALENLSIAEQILKGLRSVNDVELIQIREIVEHTTYMEIVVLRRNCSYEQDAPKFVALYIIQCACSEDGDKFQMVKTTDILNKLSEKNKNLLRYETYQINVPPDFRKVDTDYIYGSIVLGDDLLRYRRDIIDQNRLINETAEK